MIEFYLSNVSDPMAFFGKVLAQEFHKRAVPGFGPVQYDGLFDKNFFSKFRERFNCVSISAGIPRLDYGQTIQFSCARIPKLQEMEWRDIPEHLISAGLPLKPDEMSGRYRYQRKEDTRGHTLAVEEFFFFEFREGYSLESFSQLCSSISELRYLSSIQHRLDRFCVMPLGNGVYVSLRARIDDSYKLAFAMNS